MTTEISQRRSGVDVRRILESLPEWFGDTEAIDNYVDASEDHAYESLLATKDATVVGVTLTYRHFREAAELHLIAVHPSARGEGVGRLLVERIAAKLAADNCALLSVHTVGPSFENGPYAQTRGFYSRLGFFPMEEHHGLDWPGPTLILVRPLGAPETA